MKITKNIIEEIKMSLEEVGLFGSVEIYVQNGKVTQITGRKIKKTANLEIQDKN